MLFNTGTTLQIFTRHKPRHDNLYQNEIFAMIRIPGYDIKEKLYEGVHSLVFRARKEDDNQAVIIKILKDEYPTPDQIVRFKQEYQITHDFHNDNIIKVYDLQKYKHTFVMVIEDFGGLSLENIYKKQKIKIKTFLRLAIQLVDIVGEVHAYSVIHKDINPSNIIMNTKTGVLKLIDFGISTLLRSESLEVCNPNFLEGTLAYISPEQTGRMNRAMDYRTDYYSLGVVFYEMLTGMLPFQSQDAMELVYYHIAKNPVSPSDLDHNIPDIVSQIILKLMAKTAENRYQSAHGIKWDLMTCLQMLNKKNLLLSLRLLPMIYPNVFIFPKNYMVATMRSNGYS